MVDGPPENRADGLGGSARESLLWSGGFTLLRDVVQLITMLILVRLLAPEDYGTAALAQSIVGVISVASFGMFVSHALQLRDPCEIDWQAHFSAAAAINTVMFTLTLGIAWLLWLSESYHRAALPLAGLATVLLIEIPSMLQHRRLETRHDWRRYRILLILGTVLGTTTGVLIALAGGGVWALVVQPPLHSLPGAVDLFWHERWRPDWSWSWPRYRQSARFGLNRMGAMAVIRSRLTIEQTWFAKSYDFATLGLFTRAIGLATLIAGRLGSIVMASLYPIVTRVEERSGRFQRMSDLIMRGVCWSTIPAALFLGLTADSVVALLYGPRWTEVVALLPLAAASVALAGTASAASGLLLANKEVRCCLVIDLASGFLGVGLALWLIPLGVSIYLAALVGHGLFVVSVTFAALTATRGITHSGLLTALIPATIASAGAALTLASLQRIYASDTHLALRFIFDVVVFGGAYVALLRIAFPGSLRDILQVAPGGMQIARAIGLAEVREL